jgi:hypothetical protein
MRNKLATDQIAITQDVLADVFIGPMSARMIESTKEFLKTGKFLDLRNEMQLSLRALWDRTMFAGIADAEFEIDNVKRNREPDIGFNINSFSNLIEFNREDELRDELVNLSETLEIAKETNSLPDITRIEGEIGQTLAELQGIQERKQNPPQARKKTKVLDLSKKATKVVNPKPDPVSTERVVSLEGQGTNLLRNETKEQRKKRLIRDLIRSKRTNLGNVVRARNNFDPVNSREELRDPYKDLYVKESRSQTARNRLKQMEALQMWVTLNDRYPAIGQESEFAQTYLNRRVQTVANDLDRKYQEDVKQIIAEYVKKDPQKRSANKVLEEVKKIYLTDQRERYGSFVENLKSKRDSTKHTNLDHFKYLLAQTDNPRLYRKLSRYDLLDEQLEDLSWKMLAFDSQNDEGYQKLNQDSKKIEDLRDSLLDELEDKDNNVDRKLLNRLKVARKRLEQNGKNEKHYTDPRQRIQLSKKERQTLVSLLGIDKDGFPEEILNKKEFSAKELSFYITRLNAKAGRVDDKLISTVAKVATTEVSAAYNIGRLQSYLDRGVKYVQWVSTIDSRTSKFCWSMHERIFPLNELLAQNMGKQAFPKTGYPEYHPKNQQVKSKSGLSMWVPPVHPNAYLPDTKVTSVFPELLMRKRYVGKAITIKTEHGNTLSVTIEHPILTDRGFIRAGDLKGGEYIFDTFDSQGTVISNPNYYDSIPSVEELFNFSRVSKSLVRGIVPVATKDLDSNICSTEDKVDIINTARDLLNSADTQFGQNLSELNFNITDTGLTPKKVNGVTNTIFRSPFALPPSVISRSYHLPTLFGTLPCVEDFVGSGVITDFLTRLSKDSFYNTTIYANSLSDFSKSDTADVGVYNNVSEFIAKNNFLTFPSDVVVKRSKISQIIVKDYDGFVYHVQDASGINIANGIVAHNCRSFLTPIYTDQKTDLYPPELPPTSDLGEAFINRQRLEDKDVRKLIERQERELQDKIDRLGLNIDELHDLFDNGLKFLTRRIRESEPQLAKFTPEEIRKNDKALVNALLTGGVVLGTGAMMYFFVKSNLGNKLQQYVKTSATGVLGGLVTNGLSNDAISNYLKNLIRQDRRLRDLPETTQLLLPSADEIEQLQNDESVIQQVNDNAIKSETILELAARGEYNPQLLASAGATPGKILTNIQRDMKMIANLARTKRDLAFRRVEPLISQMFSNANFKVNSAPGSFTLGDINKITRFDKVYHVVASRAGSTFISRKGFDAIVGNPKYREQLQRYVSELDDIETALNNLDDYMEKADPLTKANFSNEKAQVAKAKNLINYALNQNNIENAADSLTENLDRLTNIIATNENLIETIVQTEGQINEIADRLIKDLDKVMPSNRLLDNLVVSEVSDVAELRKVQKLVKASLAEMRKDFLTKNKSYTLGTAARKRDSTLSERYVQAVTDVENRTLLLNQSGLTYDNNVANIEQYFKDQVNERAQRLINLNNEITNRINELK